MFKFCTNFFTKKLDRYHQHKAFTLAEVLITLGIIGVVAAMTIPALIAKQQKHQTVTRLKEAYTTLFQAIKLSEIDNGSIENWDFGVTNDGAATLNWFNTYLAPYMKITDTGIYSVNTAHALVYLANGSILRFWNNGSNRIHAVIHINGLYKTQDGKDTFTYFIGGTPVTTNIKEIRPYDSSLTEPPTRDVWLNHVSYGCKSTANKGFCAGLIMNDGWQILDDYPYFN